MGTPSAETFEFTSVIMAIRNEEENITATLDALAAQTCALGSYELVIADGCSTDRTLDLVTSFAAAQKEKGLTVTILENSGQSAAAGLNQALQSANGSVIVRVDGHTTVATDYLASVHAVMKASGADCVGGLQIPRSSVSWGKAYGHATSGYLGSGGADFRSKETARFTDTVYLGAWQRATFHKFGEFDASLERNQDDEHNMRILDGGGRVFLDPAIRSTYRPRESAAALARQYYSYGLWKPIVLKRHPRRIRLRHLYPSALVMLAWAAAVFPSSAFLLLAYVLIIALVSITKAWNAKDLALASFIFATFLIMHFTYGLGFLFGLPRIPLSHLAETSSNETQPGVSRD
jgi:succinoglycan biosynthesis protein ExoA